jgi:hypothetical protein
LSVLGELTAVELDETVAALRGLWERLKGEAVVPPRSAFTPELLKRWLPNIVIVVAIGGRFNVRLAGTAAVRFAGRDFTGKFLDEVVHSDQYERTVAPYRRAIAIGESVEDEILPQQFIAPDGTSLAGRRLVMPCSSDGQTIDRFVVGLFLYQPDSR